MRKDIAEQKIVSRQYFQVLKFSLSVGILGALLASCGGVPTDRTPSAGDEPIQSCSLTQFPLQPRERFPQATPFYLPGVENPGADVTCVSPTWSLEDRPDGSLLKVGQIFAQSAESVARFIPDLPGTYRFQASVAGQDLKSELTVGVVPLSDVPFHNYNYTTTTALVGEDSKIYVADPIGNRVFEWDVVNDTLSREMPVGGWPVALARIPSKAGILLVVMKASDALGFLDLSTGRLVDALPIGDEPSDIIVSRDGTRAFVSLATTGEIVSIDLESRRVSGRVASVRDPRALALSPDGKFLYAVSHRSGTHVRYPYPDAPIEEQKDLAVIDTNSLTVAKRFGDLGTTLTGLALSPDGQKIYLARLRNDTTIALAKAGNQSFLYEIAVLDSASGSLLASRQFQAREGVEGDFPLVAPVGLALEGKRLWVTFEANDLALELDSEDLTELRRISAPGRPRAVIAHQQKIFVHGHQGFALTVIDGENPAGRTRQLTKVDPRGEILARGQRYFTGAGRNFAQGWSCNSCHVEGTTDTVVWNAGPVKDTHVSKPFFWLEGTAPLGWQGYMSGVKNYSYEVHSNVGTRADDSIVEGVQAYLRSLTVPPPANSKTTLDGSLSTQAVEGKLLFEGKGGCASCHAGPVGTNGRFIPVSSTPDAADTPSLVGAYRHGIWLKHGEASTLRSAVDNMADFFGAQLDDAERSRIVRYLEELTGRDFFLMSSNPTSTKMSGSAVSTPEIALDVGSQFELIFSLPVHNHPENLKRIRIVDGNGRTLPTDVRVEGPRRVLVSLADAALFEFDAKYGIELDPNLEAFSEQRLVGQKEISFRTASMPVIRMEGEYTLRAWSPRLVIDPKGNYFDQNQSRPVPMVLRAEPTASGASLLLDLQQGLTFPVEAVLSGRSLYIPPTPVMAGPASFVDGFSGYFDAEFEDRNGDGIGDYADGLYSYTGPGFRIEGMKWELVRNETP